MNSAGAAIAAAESHLAGRDPVLAGLVARYGPCTLVSRRRPTGGHFEALASSIAYQQLAGRAAEVIWGRVRALVPGDFTAPQVVALELGALRSAGLSEAKARSVADLASRVTSGTLDLDHLASLDDEEVVAQLSEVRGIGRWTAQMFLLFRLGRLDVWPTGDLGVRRGYALAYSLDAPPPATAMEGLGQPFRPWRSVVAWYCWRAADQGVSNLPTGR